MLGSSSLKQEIHGIIFGGYRNYSYVNERATHLFSLFFCSILNFVSVRNYIVNKCAYPFGLNLFFQPGLGPGFFFTLDSSGTFGLRLLFRIAPFRALEGKLKRVTPELPTPAIFNDGQWETETPPPLVWVRIKQLVIIGHPVFSTLLQIIFRDDPECTVGVTTAAVTVF